MLFCYANMLLNLVLFVFAFYLSTININTGVIVVCKVYVWRLWIFLLEFALWSATLLYRRLFNIIIFVTLNLWTILSSFEITNCFCLFVEGGKRSLGETETAGAPETGASFRCTWNTELLPVSIEYTSMACEVYITCSSVQCVCRKFSS